MYRSFAFKVLRLMALLAPFIGVPAFAQFEVAPDHFDSDESQHKPAGKQAKIATTATPVAAVASAATEPARARRQRNDASGTALTSQGLRPAKTAVETSPRAKRHDRNLRAGRAATDPVFPALEGKGLVNKEKAHESRN